MCECGGSLLDMSSPPPPASPDGALRYRVAVLPATCKGGRHLVIPGVSRAIAIEGEVRVDCPACAATPGADASWRLSSSRPSPDRAELDDEPYGDLVLHRVRTVAGTR
jgi:hypothetical protein